ncbi:hypothetical protein BDN71DRAFT_1526060 [Pleurotus eryngii]|uniref:Uncharacterized protein n=1 Tax=Pleurotus eryngii TaxID=5323 RepID=A0A9P6DBK4_PLEER|nr:hypothetical protein BDN71DRAFT_1526060 [Pleurotus eryngii]
MARVGLVQPLKQLRYHARGICPVTSCVIMLACCFDIVPSVSFLTQCTAYHAARDRMIAEIGRAATHADQLLANPKHFETIVKYVNKTGRIQWNTREQGEREDTGEGNGRGQRE